MRITLAVVFLYIVGLAACGPSKPSKPSAPEDKSASARYVCRGFLERSGYSATEWGNAWEWTTVDNKDGTWSVGARFMGAAPGGQVRNLYVTCVAANSGDNWSLVRLTRLK